MSSKKGKKTKGKTISIHEFNSIGPDSPTPVKSSFTSSWAEDVEEESDFGYPVRKPDTSGLPKAPRSTREPDYDDASVPMDPPYVAYISNLPYEIEENDIYDFFDNLKISNVRLPRESTNKPKGYGYVEFEDRNSLIQAMNKIDMNLGSRRIRIEISNNSTNDRSRGGMGRDNRRDYNDDPERTTGDWRRDREDMPPLPDRDNDRGFRRGFDRRDGGDRDRDSDDIRQGAWREGNRPPLRDDRDSRGGGERDWSRFSNRGDGGNRDEDRGSSFGPRRFGGDSDDRRWNDRGSRNPPPSEDSGEPRTRPKLNLQPRTKPIDSTAVSETPVQDKTAEPVESDSSTPAAAPPKPASVPAASIFGAARPVDTAAREREIEERLKKSSEEKAEETEKKPAWGRRNGDTDRSRNTWRPNDGERKTSFGPRREPSSRSPSSKGEDRNTNEESRPQPSGERPRIHLAPRTIPREVPELKPEKEKVALTEEEELQKMPKAKDDITPNFVASNKYSMLPDDVDPDNVEE